MAKTPVELQINEFKHKKREVSSFTMMFTQAVDMEGQVTGLPRGGKITLRMKAFNDGNSDLVCWMTDTKQAYNGKIVFYDTTDGKLMKTIQFQDAYCVSYIEQWSDTVKDVELAHWEEIVISCRIITDGGALNFKNTWELVE
jgi:hypothetical protein